MTLGRRLKQRRKALGLSQKALADMVGLKQPTIANLESGYAKTTPSLHKIARALRTSPEWLETGRDVPAQPNVLPKGQPSSQSLPQGAEPVARIPVIGEVNTGSWRTGGEMGQALRGHPAAIFAPSSPDYPQAEHFAYRVVGNGMDAADKPISEGDYAVCVDAADLLPETGKIYAVRRTREGGMVETSLRRARVFKTRVELHSESTGDYPPVEMRSDQAEDEEGPDLIGLVYGIWRFA